MKITYVLEYPDDTTMMDESLTCLIDAAKEWLQNHPEDFVMAIKKYVNKQYVSTFYANLEGS